MANTEKPATKAQQKKNSIVGTPKKQDIQKVPLNKPKEEVKKTPENKQKENLEKKEEVKKPQKVEKPKVKKTEVVVNAQNIHISTKHSMAICKFIKYKTTGDAIRDLEKVLTIKKAVPMKGEIPHRKGMMSGRFPVKAVAEFIVLIKSLASNAAEGEIDDPIIVEAIANIGVRPYGRFGRVRKKRTHVRIVAKEKRLPKNKEKKK